MAKLLFEDKTYSGFLVLDVLDLKILMTSHAHTICQTTTLSTKFTVAVVREHLINGHFDCIQFSSN